MIELPDDLKSAPFEIIRDFITKFNMELLSGKKDPTKVAREYLVRKFGGNDEAKTS